VLLKTGIYLCFWFCTLKFLNFLKFLPPSPRRATLLLFQLRCFGCTGQLQKLQLPQLETECLHC
jgi:hypothetical protein